MRLEFEGARTDRYNRTLAYVYLPDGTLLNAEIIRQGYGHAYTQFPFSKMEEFRALQREAMAHNRGLWTLKSWPSLAEWTIALLALAVIPALLLESRDTTPGVQLTAQVINWAVWLAFCADAIVR